MDGDGEADVCVIGAGFTGLSAALHLAERGHSVVVLEAHRIGWGASGRNGGQVGSGQRIEQPELEEMFGQDRARALWEIGEAAKALVKDLVARHDIACALKPGIIHANHRARYDKGSAEFVDHMNRHYGTALSYLDPRALQGLVRSPRYSGGVLDPEGAHLHPLDFVRGLARAAEAAGVTIHEMTEVTHVGEGGAITALGRVSAEHVILACNGYLGALQGEVARHVMPINNFIIATEPLGADRAADLLTRDVAVADSKFVVNYFRLSEDRRLLFGGRESYGYRFPRDIKGFVRKAMIDIFPQARDLRIDYGWGGTLAITMNRLPHLRRLAGGIWTAGGYSGHGVALATMSGKLIADAIEGDARGFDVMAELETPAFPGGAAWRHPLLIAAMLWYGLRDRI